jgi:hypothetical protein
MRNILLRTNIFDLLNCRDITKFSYDKLIFRSNCNKISTNKEKSREEKSAKKRILEILI